MLKVPIGDVLDHDTQFDLVSSQFVLQYSFESEEKVRMMFRNVTAFLKDKGILIGTIPDSRWIK
jgi:mRNA (guanine-N7-)-methyltransferase